MERLLYTYRRARGEFEAVQAVLSRDLRQLLQAGTGTPPSEPSGDGSFGVRLSGRVGPFDIERAVRVRVGQGQRLHDPERLRLPVQWQAERAARAFPSFDGRLELERLSDREVQLALIGDYTVPLGALGALGDATALYGQAERTGQHLLAGLVDQLVEAQRAGRVSQAGREPSLLRVADVMTPDPFTLNEDLPLRAGAMLLLHQQVSGAPVVDDDGRLVGVLSESDLLHKEAVPRHGLGRRASDAERRRSARTVGEACSRPARTTSPEVLVHAAAREMADHDVGRLIVLESDRIAGIITRRDVLRALDRSDVDIRDAVLALLDELGETDLAATVEWGEVALSGRATSRGRIEEIVRRAEQIDGVIAVDVDPGLTVDDRAAPRG